MTLELRKQIKKKKPNFLRQDHHKKARLDKKWRKPKGIQSKVRLSKKGYRVKVRPGYGSPLDVKGMDAHGKVPVVINTISELNLLDVAKNSVILGGTVGMKKRVELIAKVQELKLNVINVKDLNDYVGRVAAIMKAKKEKRTMKLQKKEEKSKEEKQAKTEKEKQAKMEETKEGKDLTDKLDEKQQDKKELDKVLTKKQ